MNKITMDRNETWLPLKPDNPSKLTLCKFVDGVWKPTSFCRYAPWPEKFKPYEDVHTPTISAPKSGIMIK